MCAMARFLQAGAVVLALTALVACQVVQPRPADVVWGDRVPSTAPDATQHVVARGATTLVLLPTSPTGAQVGVIYQYDMPHCGIGSPIDVDGSFWDALDPPTDPVLVGGQRGTFTLETATVATFVADNGLVLHLTRHAGAKEFFYCA